MLNTIAQFIKNNNLLPCADHRVDNERYAVVVALSGGADSVALLHILHSLHYNCIAAHCNFHLRGDESDRDEVFVRQLCQQMQIKLHVKHFDTHGFMQSQHLSLEMAARQLRYQWFEQLMEQTGSIAVAVAHNKNDQAETIILNLQRGSGIKGLCGMHPKNGNIIRPLLNTTRTDIEHYLTLNNIPHVEDSTNADTTYRRNHIRAQLKQWQPAQVANIAFCAELMQGYNQLLQQLISQYEQEITKQDDDTISININRLQQKPAAKTILYEIISKYGFKDVDAIYNSLNNEPGRKFYSDTHTALKDRNFLLIYPTTNNADHIPEIRAEIINNDNNIASYKSTGNECYLAADNVDIKSLALRHWQEADYFCPFGMKGQKKKLSDFFTDCKLSLKQKNEIWLLTADDKILWIVGYRTDHRYKITDHTKKILHITIQ